MEILIENVMFEVLDVERSSVKSEDMDTVTATLLLIGYCSVSELSNEVDLDCMINSVNIKKRGKRSFSTDRG